MHLTPEQRAQFDRDGYLFFPGLFSPEETKRLTDAVPDLYARRDAYNVREKGSDAVRTNFAAHLYSEPFARLARHPRMIGPVADLIGFNRQLLEITLEKVREMELKLTRMEEDRRVPAPMEHEGGGADVAADVAALLALFGVNARVASIAATHSFFVIG